MVHGDDLFLVERFLSVSYSGDQSRSHTVTCVELTEIMDIQTFLVCHQCARHMTRKVDDLPRDEENAMQCETDMMYHQSMYGDILSSRNLVQ